MKILVVRFSSIGDIVLTTPVVRCLKEQIPDVEIHYLSKSQFRFLLEPNPYISKVHYLSNHFKGLVDQLRNEQFDWIIDLHNNLRTHRLSSLLSVQNRRVNKENGKKLRMVYFKDRKIKNRHIVDRYMETVNDLGVVNDNKGLDYFFPEGFNFNDGILPPIYRENYICLAIGGQHETKKMPENQLVDLCKKINGPILILGGPEDQSVGESIAKKCANTRNLAGQISFHESAELVKNSYGVITHDTGIMHVAAAFKKRIYSIWGNTIPEFGMTPYMADSESIQFEVKNLNCRPCSKIGYDKCPKGHFKCMKEQDFSSLYDLLKD